MICNPSYTVSLGRTQDGTFPVPQREVATLETSARRTLPVMENSA